MNKGNDTGSMGTSVEPSDRKRTVEEGNDLEKNNSSAMNDQTDRGSAAPKPKRIKSKHQEPSVRAIRSVIQQCCARNDLRKAIEAYEKTIADKTRLEPQSFYNLLSLCDGLSDRGIHVGTPKLSTDNDQKDLISTQHVDEESRLRYAKRIKEHMDQLKLPLTETAWSALVKLHSRNHQFDLAEQHLTEAESTQQCRPKLRMYSALLVAYCEIGRMQDALIVWLRLSKINLAVSEREYLALIQCATKYGFARVMERVLQDLSEDVLVPSKETSRALEEWFQSAYATNATVANDSVAIDSILQQIQAPSADQLPATFKFKIQSATGWVVSSGCPVEMTSGELLEGCLKNCNLKPVTISEQCWLEMKEMNETIVSSGKIDGDMSGVQGGRKGPKRQVTDREQRKKYWSLFHSFLERQCSVGKFDVIIDGANVGYYQQNYQSAPRHVDYRQIDWLVKHFQKENKKVLLVIHSRHFAPNLMPRQYIPLERSWRDDGILYCTPPCMNDDWFWLHAALYCGPGTLVVTNDEMRDHHFQMLAPRSFLRWKDRHQVHFSFGQWRQDHSREVNLIYPDVYSRRIQCIKDGLVIPWPKRGDERRFLDGTHVACEDDPTEETYVCIRPRSK